MERNSSPSKTGNRALNTLAILTAALFSLLRPASLLACPSCKDHLAANGLDTGYAVSILIMILVPLTIVAAWTVLILRLRSAAQPETGN